MRPSVLALATLLAALAATGCRSASARPAPAGAGEGRPVVLLVHGRGRIGDDTASLRRDWERALNEGLQGIGAAARLRDGDVRLVWYADVLDPRSDAGCSPPVRTRSARDTSGGVSGLSVFASIAGALLDAAAEGADAGSDDARQLRNVAADLHFFGSARTRCAAERRVGDALARAQGEGRPVILVAYSLGALVSWGHLHDRALAEGGDGKGGALPRVERLVTLGSPVGSPDVRALVLGGDTARVALPAGVQSWLNVIDPDDSFAVPLAPARDRATKGITDVRRERADGDTPHDIVGYLRDPATARAIAAVLR
ncbi:MAG TPA: hypothetical protein VGD77_13660 [Gemmatimonadaceae bacterium]